MTAKGTNPSVKSQNAVYRKILGGMLGGLTEALCLHPLDTVKTRLQLSKVRTNAFAPYKPYKGIRDCATQIVRKEGILSLYKGLIPFSGNLITKYCLRYGANFQIRALICGKDVEKTTWRQNLLAGMTAGALEALVIVTPFEVVKTRLQGQRGRITGAAAKKKLKYRGPAHAVARIIRREGIRGLWQGGTPTLIRQSSNQAAMFTSYTFIRENLWEDPQDLKAWQAGVTGLTAACVGPLCNGPIDIIKTRMMNQTISTITPSERYKNIFDAFRRIYKAEGIRGLYTGLPIRLARVAPGQGITWIVIENFNSLCNRREWFID